LSVQSDNEGFLLDSAQWSVRLAEEIAKEENIKLDEDHWTVVKFIRDYFDEKQTVLETKFALKHLKIRLTKNEERAGICMCCFPTVTVNRPAKSLVCANLLN